LAVYVAARQAFCSVDKREGSCNGSCATTERMLASCAGWVSVTCRLIPFAREAVFLSVADTNEGLKPSAEQPATWKGLDRDWLAPSVESRIESVLSAPQLVGLRRKLALLTSTWMALSRRGTPLTIVGSEAATITRAVAGSTEIAARVTTRPRSKWPAAASIGIERP
jgi:hypothetical protein